MRSNDVRAGGDRTVTVVCRVEALFPVAVVALYGTLDQPAASSTLATLQECLAEQPVQLVLDAAHLEIPDLAEAQSVAGLAATAGRWPGTRIAVCSTDPALRRTLGGLAGPGAIDFYPGTGEAVAAGQRLPVPPRVTADLAPNREAPAVARELVANVCHRWGLDRWSRLAQLLTSELVTNAVVHAGTPILLALRHLQRVLQVAVRDGHPRLVPATRSAGREPGRGLLLLSTLADTWGSAPAGVGKVTWANVALAPEWAEPEPAGPDRTGPDHPDGETDRSSGLREPATG